ncbi:NTP transferase domain-containing protein, partial [Candidatus Parcubacteria bacterium]|nr:NTP transferase domain-containing protein [Candidatus Parcubacteria bacterium]
MHVVILAAGKGTRMGALTKNIPKPLLKVGSQPILVHTLSVLPK